jgi:hypothetical protein
MLMPWGKFKGVEIHRLPSSYLRWLAENCEDDEISCQADDEWTWREHYNQHFEND